MGDIEDITGEMHKAVTRFAEAVGGDGSRWEYRIEVEHSDGKLDRFRYTSDMTQAEMVSRSLEHGGEFTVDLGIVQARRLDHIEGNLVTTTQRVMAAWVEQHDADERALRDAARSIVMDASGYGDQLTEDARRVVGEARSVLDGN